MSREDGTTGVAIGEGEAPAADVADGAKSARAVGGGERSDEKPASEDESESESEAGSEASEKSKSAKESEDGQEGNDGAAPRAAIAEAEAEVEAAQSAFEEAAAKLRAAEEEADAAVSKQVVEAGLQARIDLDEQLKAAKEDFELARAEALQKAQEDLQAPSGGVPYRSGAPQYRCNTSIC
ncbi:unnamed protein product [Effrenium voratum]|nr:unnamed protein product [Effrenium voratum]